SGPLPARVARPRPGLRHRRPHRDDVRRTAPGPRHAGPNQEQPRAAYSSILERAIQRQPPTGETMKNTLETRLGIFFALALVVAVVILEMIGGADFFKGGYLISANFKNVQELKKGDLVKMAGVEIGRVDKVELKTDPNGVAVAKVTMKINGDYEIKTDSKALIKFTGLMGQNYVSIE